MKKKGLVLFYRILGLVIVVRLYLQLLINWAIKRIPFKGSFPYRELILTNLGPDWLWLWGNFDGVHYLYIAKVGYEYGLTQAFFPLYPLMIRYLNFITHNSLWSGLLISSLSLVGFIYFFIKLGLLDYSKKTVSWASLFLLIFPTSFFFFALYTESLFLLLAIAAFYSARKKRFLLSSLLVGLASATRLIGIFLLPAILWEYWQANKKKRWSSLLAISAIGSSGLLTYLKFLGKKFGDSLIFVNSQPGFGAGRQVDKLILIYQVIARYIKMLLTVSVNNDIYPVLVFEFIISLAFISLIVWALIKKFRPSYLIFVIPSFFLSTLTGSFSSVPRYVLACFPLFYLMADSKYKKIKPILALLFFLLLSWAFIRFARGYWLA